MERIQSQNPTCTEIQLMFEETEEKPKPRFGTTIHVDKLDERIIDQVKEGRKWGTQDLRMQTEIDWTK